MCGGRNGKNDQKQGSKLVGGGGNGDVITGVYVVCGTERAQYGQFGGDHCPLMVLAARR